MGRRALPLEYIKDKTIRERSSGKRLCGLWKKATQLGIYSGAKVTVIVEFPDAEPTVFHNEIAPLTWSETDAMFTDKELLGGQIMEIYPPTLRSTPKQARSVKCDSPPAPEPEVMIPFPPENQSDESLDDSRTDVCLDYNYCSDDLLLPPVYEPLAHKPTGAVHNRVLKTMRKSNLYTRPLPKPVPVQRFSKTSHHWEEE